MNRIRIIISKPNENMPESEITTALELPTGFGELTDALDKTRFTEDSMGTITISHCDALPELDGEEIDPSQLEELNYFASRLDSLSADEQKAFRAVYKCMGDRELSLADLINMTYGLDNIPMAPIGSDEEYGKFIVENGMMEALEDVPDSALEYLDNERIGAAMRQSEQGEYIDGYYIIPTDFEIPDVYDGINIPDSDNIRAVAKLELTGVSDDETENVRTLYLPADDETIAETAKQLGVKRIRESGLKSFITTFPQIGEMDFDTDGIDELNRLAGVISGMSDGERIKFKAVLEAEKVGTIGEALKTAEDLDSYRFEPDHTSPYDFGRAYLSSMLPEGFDTTLFSEAAITDFGFRAMERLGASQTEYGIVSAKGGSLTEIITPENKEQAQTSEQKQAAPENAEMTGRGEEKTISAQETAQDRLDVVEVFGQRCLFSNNRISPEELPEGVLKYELREGDEMPFATLEENVRVNFAGTILAREPFDFAGQDFLAFTDDTSPNFLSETGTIEEYAQEEAEESEEAEEVFIVGDAPSDEEYVPVDDISIGEIFPEETAAFVPDADIPYVPDETDVFIPGEDAAYIPEDYDSGGYIPEGFVPDDDYVPDDAQNMNMGGM